MTAAVIEALSRLKPAQIARIVASLPPRHKIGFDRYFTGWAHPSQKPPHGDWRHWIIMAGRGFGKTRAGTEWIAARARADGSLRIALVAATHEEARSIMIEGESGLLSVAGDEIAAWKPSLHLLKFASGAKARLFSGASPEQLRGPQHHIAWCDELAKWRHPRATWDMLQLGLRLGAAPRTLITTTPRPGAMLEEIMALPGAITTGGATRANIHLAPEVAEGLHALYRGTRLERQELEGELLSDTPGALWSVELLERCRLLPSRLREGPGVGESVDTATQPDETHPP